MNSELITQIKAFSQETINGLAVFSNSKLPDIYFHGTKESFTEFCPTKKGENTSYNNTNQGFFFANEQGLNRIKKDNPDTFGEVTLSVRLNVKNPVNLSIQSIFTNVDQASIIWESISQEKETNEVALAQLNENIGMGEISELFDHFNSEHFLKTIKESGYDGIVSEMGDRQLQYIAFEPSQIQILTPDAIINAYHSGVNKLLVKSIESELNRNQVRPRMKM